MSRLYETCKKCRVLLEQFGPAAHEVNNKLTVAAGSLEFVKDDPELTEQHRKMIVLAVQASREFAEISYRTSVEIGNMLHLLQHYEKENGCGEQ